MNGNLSEANFFLYAAHHYLNPCVDEEEFLEDLSRIKVVRRLFSRFKRRGDLKERIIINNLTILYNVFEHRALTRMLAFRLHEYLPILKPFLMLLNYWPDRIENIGDGSATIISSDIMMDMRVIEVLRKI
jgi:hypothetical protein